MAYSLTLKAIQRVKPYLDAMVKSEETLKWKSDDPRKLAYYIHEGLASAKKFNFTQYSRIRDKYKIRYTEKEVIADYQNLPAAAGELTFEGILDPFQIVQTLVKHKELDFDLFFKDTILQPDDLELVSDWCQENGFEFTEQSNGLLIKKNADTQSAEA